MRQPQESAVGGLKIQRCDKRDGDLRPELLRCECDVQDTSRASRGGKAPKEAPGVPGGGRVLDPLAQLPDSVPYIATRWGKYTGSITALK